MMEREQKKVKRICCISGRMIKGCNKSCKNTVPNYRIRVCLVTKCLKNFSLKKFSMINVHRLGDCVSVSCGSECRERKIDGLYDKCSCWFFIFVIFIKIDV